MKRNTRVCEEVEALEAAHQSLAAPSPSEAGGGEEHQRRLKLDHSKILDSDCITSMLLFHPYEPLLVLADNKDRVSVFNCEDTVGYGGFCNNNAPGSRMTSMAWINEAQESLLLTGADDGVVRVWDGLLQGGMNGPGNLQAPRLVTSLDAAPGLRMGQTSGLVTDWQQKSGLLFTGGQGVDLKAWDLGREQCWAEWEVYREACVTVLAAPPLESPGFSMQPGCVLGGFMDGAIQLYDPREKRAVQRFTDHDSWIVNLHFTKEYEFLSACLSGSVRMWDVRKEGPPKRSILVQRASMTALAVHKRIPIMASGSHNQFIKILTLDGEALSLIRYHQGFLAQRVGPITALAFHPNKLMLAAGATDSITTIYTPD
ncbi:unnamed protein product [Discosporangium mesarthrocarpum]